jgi:hypothetical protein
MQWKYYVTIYPRLVLPESQTPVLLSVTNSIAYIYQSGIR